MPMRLSVGLGEEQRGCQPLPATQPPPECARSMPHEHAHVCVVQCSVQGACCMSMRLGVGLGLGGEQASRSRISGFKWIGL
jgi:hypothetical protein